MENILCHELGTLRNRMEKNMKKFFGNNAVVGQSGGPTAAINETLAGVIKGALENDAIATLYGMKNGVVPNHPLSFVC